MKREIREDRKQIQKEHRKQDKEEKKTYRTRKRKHKDIMTNKNKIEAKLNQTQEDEIRNKTINQNISNNKIKLKNRYRSMRGKLEYQIKKIVVE